MNMKDPIERQDAIDAVEKESQVDGSYGYMDTKSIVDLLNDLPSAQQWIPVSEKPIPKGLVFVTYNDGDVDLLSQPTSYRRGDIVAWMPSPEPYQEENDD